MTRSDAFDPGELAAIRSTADELERYARTTDVAPRPIAAASILAAIAAEPTPAPLVAMAAATRARRPAGIVGALRDAWRVTWSGSRPVGIRLSSGFAVLLLLAVVGSTGGIAAAAAWNALQPGPTVPPTPTQLPVVVPPINPSPSPEPAATAVPTDATATPGPSPSPSPKATHGATPKPTSRPTSRPTPRPTPRPTHQWWSPMPSHHPEPTHHGGWMP